MPEVSNSLLCHYNNYTKCTKVRNRRKDQNSEWAIFAYPLGYVIIQYMPEKRKKLIHHISRLEGQLASVKRQLQEEVPDCEKAALTLKAASRSFSTLRMSFVSCFLEEKYLPKKEISDETYSSLLQVINS